MIELDPKDPNTVDLTIAREFAESDQVDKALQTLNIVLERDPNSWPGLYLYGWCLIKSSRFGLAYTLLKRSHELKKRNDTLVQIALACLGMRRVDEGEKIFKSVLQSDPSHMLAIQNLAIARIWNCDAKDAIRYCDMALAINPNDWRVIETKGYAHLMLGDYGEGWQAYEHIIGNTKQRPDKPPLPGLQYWYKGRGGMRLFLRGEQGLGDEISFASMLHEVARDQMSVTFECHPKLGGLMKRSFPEIEVQPTREFGKNVPDRDWINGRTFDNWALIGSAAQYYRKKAEDFPGTPYLIADPERRVQWKALLDMLPGKKVGIAWTGGYPGTFRQRRSLSLDDLLPILKTRGITWVSLQYEDPFEDIIRFNAKHGLNIQHWKRASEAFDYDETAALVSELDLVISVCTSVVHLSGALGKECWCLCPSKPRWFYGLTGRKVPWYNSVEIFRQVGDRWPFDEVADRLTEFVASDTILAQAGKSTVADCHSPRQLTEHWQEDSSGDYDIRGTQDRSIQLGAPG